MEVLIRPSRPVPFRVIVVTGVYICMFVLFVFCTRCYCIVVDENACMEVFDWPVPSRAISRESVVLCYRLNFNASRTVVVILVLQLLLVYWSTTKQLVDMLANILVHVRKEDWVGGGLTEGVR
jgi:hypothetical protein